jgi:hypothetical protein
MTALATFYIKCAAFGFAWAAALACLASAVVEASSRGLF